MVAEEACFADSKKDDGTSNNPFSNNAFETSNGNDFEITSNDDLPF